MPQTRLPLVCWTLVFLSAFNFTHQQNLKWNENEDYDEISDSCNVQIERVLLELKTCASQKSNDDRRNEAAENFAQQQHEETKAQLKKQAEQLEMLNESINQLQKQLEILNNKKMQPSLSECQRIRLSAKVTSLQFFSANNRKFYLSTSPTSWDLSHEWCQSMGMHLPLLKNLHDILLVTDELKKLGFIHHNFWVSGGDMSSSAGTFLWTDKTPVDNSTWHLGRPAHYKVGQTTCLYLYTGSARLCDWKCGDSKIMMICEVPQQYSSCL